MKPIRQRFLAVLGKLLLCGLLLGGAQIAAAQDYVWAADFPVGTAIPELSAQDQNGQLRTFDELKGDKGMLFMLSRSFDW